MLQYQRYSLLLGAARKNALEDVSADSLALHIQNFVSATKKNIVPKFTNRLIWILHKIHKYHSFLWVKFSRIETGHIREDTNQRKHVYSHILPSVTCSLISPEPYTL